MNILISIGYVGTMKCYLNVDKSECIDRYCKSENITREYFEDDFHINVDVIVFEEEFGAYTLWEDEEIKKK